MTVGEGIAVAGLAWLVVGVGALALEVLRLRTMRAVHATADELRQLVDDYGRDMLREAEWLREAVEAIRGDERLDRVLDELREVRDVVGRRPS